MSKHTPGPWKAQLYEGTGWKGPYSKWEIFACDTPETYVAGVNEDNDNVAENARLIAAAPEMFALLERIRDDESWRTNDNALWPDLLAAIAKAKGEQ